MRKLISRHLLRLRRIATMAVWILLVHSLPDAPAGTGEAVSLPAPTVKNRSGLRLTVDTQWVDASGYRSVRVRLAPVAGPAAQDRELRVELWPNSYSQSDGKFVASQYIELPQGSRGVTEHILVPQNQPWYRLRIEVFEGGSRWKELSTNINISNTANDEWSEGIPAVLVIHSAAPDTTDRADQLARYRRNRQPDLQQRHDLPDIRGLALLVDRANFFPSGEAKPSDMELIRQLQDTARMEMLPPKELPAQWIGFSCFDLILVSLDQLQQLSASEPPRFRAVVAWAAAGGNLIVYGVGEGYQKLGTLESLLEISQRPGEAASQWPGWTPEESKYYNDRASRTYRMMEPYSRVYYPTDEMKEESGPIPDVRTALGTTAAEKFLHREYCMGKLVAMASDDPFPGSTTEWSWVLNTLKPDRTMWYKRHGLSLRRENKDYWEFLIPNTGMAPVAAFCVLITLFALVIGPVNYFLLFRQRRLYLLLGTIPLGAALVTFGLFAYAVLTDGLGTRVRVRSYTFLDQASDRAVCWSRQSYYAGLAPSRGLTFSDDTAVYSVEQYPNTEHNRMGIRRKHFTWDEGQNLRRGYMTSRVTSQMLTVRSRKNSIGLAVGTPVGDKPPQVENQLGAKIELLLLSDEAGNFFWAQDIEPGEKFQPQPAVANARLGDIKSLLLDNLPQEPEGLDVNEFDQFLRRGWSNWGNIDNSLDRANANTGRLERSIRRIQSLDENTFLPRTYVAVTQTSPEVPLGIAGAREQNSLHLIEGRY